MHNDILIYDDTLTRQRQIELYTFAENSNYQFHNFDSMLGVVQHGAITKPYCILSPEEINFLKLTDHIDFLKDKKYEILRQYINASTSGTDDTIHIDDHNDNTFTVLYYATPIWNINWGGHTIFTDEKEENIIKTSTFKPGRFVIFNSTIPHSATPIARIAKMIRYTIATKLRIIQ